MSLCCCFFLLFFIFLYIIGHSLSILSNIILEELPYFYRLRKTFKYILYDTEQLHEDKSKTWFYLLCPDSENSHAIEKFIKVVVNIIFWLLPIGIPLLIFMLVLSPPRTDTCKKEKLSYENNFHRIQALGDTSLAKNKIDNLLVKYFGKKDKAKDPKDVDQYFHYLYHIILKDSPSHFARIHNYVALYGFMRNMLMASVIIFYFSILIFAFSILSNKLNENVIILPLIFWLLNSLFAYGYLKYARRYSEEIIFAACVVERKEN